MHLSPFLSALALSVPALAQIRNTCLGFDGLLFAADSTQPCLLQSFIFVDDSGTQTCGGQGSSSVLGPWTGVCQAGSSIVVNGRATTATYTNATGAYTLKLTLANPRIFDECHVAGTTASSSFLSEPNCL